ncbi:MAG TPA: hypothetical protein VJL37_00645 [Flavobacterium sp.]|nr:hypothetical protein [Flavobacterium sp.]
MNFSDFKKINKDFLLTDKQLQSVVGGDNGLTSLIVASSGWNLSLVTVNNQQTATNPLGTAAMLSDGQMYFSTSSGIPLHIGHEASHTTSQSATPRI